MPFTTIKNGKRLLAAVLSALMICQTAVAADHKSNYELGLEKIKIGKWDVAINKLKKVAKSDPNYEDALNQIEFAKEKQAAASKASEEQAEINQETNRCRNLFEKERSPDAFDCVDQVENMQKEASANSDGTEFVSSALESLKTAMTPYAEVDALATLVTGITFDPEGMANAKNNLMLLEDVLNNPSFPQDAKTMAAVKLTDIYMGATMGFKTSCEIAREGTDQKAADQICHWHEWSLGKYTSNKMFLDKGVKLLGDKQVPSKLYSQYKPIGEKAITFPNPDEMRLPNISIPGSPAGANFFDSMPWWTPHAAIATVVAAVLGVIFWPRKPAPTRVQVTGLPPVEDQPVRPTQPTQPVQQATQTRQQPVQPTQTEAVQQAQTIMQPATQQPATQQPIAQVKLETPQVHPEVTLTKNNVGAWLQGPKVKMADDKNLALLQTQFKGRFEIKQCGHPGSARLEARSLNPTAMSEVDKELYNLINNAQRNK